MIAVTAPFTVVAGLGGARRGYVGLSGAQRGGARVTVALHSQCTVAVVACPH